MSRKLRDFLTRELQNLDAAGLLQEGPVLVSGQASKIRLGNQEAVNFASDNYLGWSMDKRLIEAGREALEEFGVGWASTRVASGTHAIHRKLEGALLKLLRTEDTAVFPTGYQANLSLFETLFDEQDYVFCDFALQPSIVDGIRLCPAKQFVFRSHDLRDLEDKLKRSGNARFRAIVVEGVSPQDGRIAPLAEIVALAQKYDSIVVLDDSHGIGVLGKSGRGTIEHCSVLGAIDLILGDFAHALGGQELGFVSGRKDLVSWLKQKSRSYLFTGAPSPASVGSALKAIELLLEGPEEFSRLREITQKYRGSLAELGFEVISSVHPIVSVIVGDAVVAQTLANRLLQKGFYAIGFCFPVVPRGTARIRFQLSAAHSDEDLKASLATLEELAKSINRSGR